MLPSSYKVVNDQTIYQFNNEVYHYEYLDQEVEGVVNQIATLLDNGVNINKIKLYYSY